MNPLKKIKNSTDINFLNKLLTEFIPIDYENLKRNYPFEWEIKNIHNGKYNPDELLALKTTSIDKIKSTVEKRIKELENGKN
jgi:hypothetical protein